MAWTFLSLFVISLKTPVYTASKLMLLKQGCVLPPCARGYEKVQDQHGNSWSDNSIRDFGRRRTLSVRHCHCSASSCRVVDSLCGCFLPPHPHPQVPSFSQLFYQGLSPEQKSFLSQLVDSCQSIGTRVNAHIPQLPVLQNDGSEVHSVWFLKRS